MVKTLEGTIKSTSSLGFSGDRLFLWNSIVRESALRYLCAMLL
jgi:hypothetical protein